MALDDFKNRTKENIPGKVYVTWQCLDCDLCRETAPTIFRRHNEEGYSYVIKQPETPEELSQVQESIEGCCTEAIHGDGDEFDPNTEYYTPTEETESSSSCCSLKDYGLDSSSTPTSITGSIAQIICRWFKR